MHYFKASGVAEALELLGRHQGGRLLAGGTDLIVDLRDRRHSPEALIDISEASDLNGIRSDSRAIRIGAGTTIREMLVDPVVGSQLPVLAAACKSFADYLTRNKATIGGNLANASPGADLAVPLLALDASIVLTSRQGSRELVLPDFLLGPRRTALRPGELVQEIVIPVVPPTGQAYEKLGLKHGGAIAVASTAVCIALRNGFCEQARVALGAVAPTPVRSARAEQALGGTSLRDDDVERAARAAIEDSRPITDVRGSDEYRRAMVAALVRRAISRALGMARAEGQ